MEPSVIHAIHTLQPIEETLNNFDVQLMWDINFSHTSASKEFIHYMGSHGHLNPGKDDLMARDMFISVISWH